MAEACHVPERGVRATGPEKPGAGRTAAPGKVAGQSRRAGNAAGPGRRTPPQGHPSDPPRYGLERATGIEPA